MVRSLLYVGFRDGEIRTEDFAGMYIRVKNLENKKTQQ